ncbi:aldolase/citrate lyase family protein [Microbispora rosea]|uniref:aldolase/citrate lyase family protein n=2 Tax=Microbispora rosea TaxID=58117 RepID=UPI0033CE4249
MLGQIETAEGAAAVEAIAATPGIDGVFVGPSDLAASMGVLGQQTHPDVIAAVHRTFDGVAATGKPVGVNAFDPQGRVPSADLPRVERDCSPDSRMVSRRGAKSAKGRMTRRDYLPDCPR